MIRKLAVGVALTGLAAVVASAAALGALLGAIHEFERMNEIPWGDEEL